MKFKISAQSASINQLKQHPRFDYADLEKMAESAPGLPIFYEFNMDRPIGFARSAIVSGGFLVMSGDVNIDSLSGYITVSGSIHIDDDSRTIDLISFGYTRFQTDKTLSPLEYTDD